MGSDQEMVHGSSGSGSAMDGMGTTSTRMGEFLGRRRSSASKADPKSKSDRQSIVRYWAQVQSLKQMGMPGVKARHIAYTRVFGKGDAK